MCHQARQGRLANGINIEAHLVKSFVIKKIAPIENKGRLDHGLVDSFIVQFGILRPFCENRNGMSIVRSEEHTSDSSHLVISYAVFCLKKKIISIMNHTLMLKS